MFLSFMGMESTTGWAIKNRERVWIDPKDYAGELEAPVMELSPYGIDIPIFKSLTLSVARIVIPVCGYTGLENELLEYF